MEQVVYSTVINRYEYYEKSSPSVYARKSIDGSIVGCSNCVGFCQFEGHPGFLTKKQRKQHNCISKKMFLLHIKTEKAKTIGGLRYGFS